MDSYMASIEAAHSRMAYSIGENIIRLNDGNIAILSPTNKTALIVLVEDYEPMTQSGCELEEKNAYLT